MDCGDHTWVAGVARRQRDKVYDVFGCFGCTQKLGAQSRGVCWLSHAVQSLVCPKKDCLTPTHRAERSPAYPSYSGRVNFSHMSLRNLTSRSREKQKVGLGGSPCCDGSVISLLGLLAGPTFRHTLARQRPSRVNLVKARLKIRAGRKDRYPGCQRPFMRSLGVFGLPVPLHYVHTLY